MDSGKQKIEFYVGKTCFVAFGLLGLLLLIRKGKKKSCYEILLLSLGCADILAASMFLMHGILMILSTDLVAHLSDVTKQKVQVMLNIMEGAVGVSIGLSCTNVVLITIDRYTAVNFALKHRIWVTKRRVRITLGAIWCLQPILVTSAVIRSIELSTKIFGGINISACVVLLVMYCCIIRKVRNIPRERKRWNTHQEAGDGNSNSKKERLVIINSIAVTLCFIICYAPTGVCKLLSEPTVYHTRYYYTTISFLALNPVIDPMIYFLFSYYLKSGTAKNILST